MAMAKWSGAQSITWELHDEWRTTYTSVLNYEVKEWLHVTLVLDKHPVLGTDLDLSATAYLPLGDILYTTVGARKGVFDSRSGMVPYVSVGFCF